MPLPMSRQRRALVLAGTVVTGGLIILAALVPGDLTRIAIPGVLTGVGTLSLAGLTFALLTREDEDRRSTEEALRHSATLATQASLQRRDQRARTLIIELRGQLEVHRPSRYPSVAPVLTPSGSEVRRNNDLADTLIVRQELWVTAADGRPITVTPHGVEAVDLVAGSGGEVTIPSIGASFRFDTVRALAAWDGIRQVRESGHPGEEGVAEFVVSDVYDDGTIDNYQLRQGGVPLVPNPNIPNAWFVDLTPGISGWPKVAIRAYPLTRRYWLSKARNDELKG
ncbi:MAG TPA: hypothetical protein VNU19_16730 [Candidatus Acidoferrum sp.]|nr:hypothetical protein [Candidatus Acidoferrum sp.]